MRGTFLCLPDRHFFLEGKKREIVIDERWQPVWISGSKATDFNWRSSQSRQNTQEIMEKSKGKEGSLAAEKEHEVDAKHSSRNGICGCLEEITKLAYTASLLSKWGRRLGPCSFKKISLFSISGYSHLSQHRRRVWDLSHKWEDVGTQSILYWPAAHK